jgi:RNA polymerase sigma-70 factor, ECF subfamily
MTPEKGLVGALPQAAQPEGYARLAGPGNIDAANRIKWSRLRSDLMRARTTASPPNTADDIELVRGILLRDETAFEALMRRYNGRLFRVARAILKDDRDAEDALQEAYLDAFRHMASFKGDAQLGTWLTRIVVNQALMRLRRQKRERVVLPFRSREGGPDEAEVQVADRTTESAPDGLLRAEMRRLIERRIDELPLAFRSVFVMREVEDMSVEETAESLSIPATTVRTRLFRARALLREALAQDFDAATLNVFGFAGARCDRVVAAVLARWRDGDDFRPDSSSDPRSA